MGKHSCVDISAIYSILLISSVVSGYVPYVYNGCYWIAGFQNVSELPVNGGDQCTHKCFYTGYRYAGTRSHLCYCYTVIKNYQETTGCSFKCRGQERSKEKCGGPLTVSLYDTLVPTTDSSTSTTAAFGTSVSVSSEDKPTTIIHISSTELETDSHTIAYVMVPIVIVVIAVVSLTGIWISRRKKRLKATDTIEILPSDRHSVSATADQGYINQMCDDLNNSEHANITNTQYSQYADISSDSLDLSGNVNSPYSSVNAVCANMPEHRNEYSQIKHQIGKFVDKTYSHLEEEQGTDRDKTMDTYAHIEHGAAVMQLKDITGDIRSQYNRLRNYSKLNKQTERNDEDDQDITYDHVKAGGHD